MTDVIRKVRDLQEATEAAATDLLYLDVDPEGTPVPRKITIQNTVDSFVALGLALESALGTLSTQNGNNVTITGGAISGVTLSATNAVLTTPNIGAATGISLSLTTADQGISLATNGTPFSVHCASATFNGTRDDIGYFAYNLAVGTSATKVTGAEPQLKLALEANYDSGPNNYMELNLDYLSADNGTLRRPIAVGIDRATHVVSNSFAGGYLNLANDAGVIFLTIDSIAIAPAVIRLAANGSSNVAWDGQFLAWNAAGHSASNPLYSFFGDTDTGFYNNVGNAILASTGGVQRLTIDSTALTVTTPIKPGTYTVAGLPSGTAGDMAYASNGRKAGEGAGVGTGVQVFKDGTAWIAVDTGAAVAA